MRDGAGVLTGFRHQGLFASRSNVYGKKGTKKVHLNYGAWLGCGANESPLALGRAEELRRAVGISIRKPILMVKSKSFLKPED